MHRLWAHLFMGVHMLLTVLIVILVLSLIGGGLGHSKVGVVGWSPAGIVLIILVILLLTGRLG